MYEPVTLGPWRQIARCLGSALEWGGGILPGSPGGRLPWTPDERLTDQRRYMTHKVDLAVCNIARERGRGRLTQANQTSNRQGKMLA